MLSLGKLSPQREGYYLECLAAGGDEYYLAAGERPGYWLGGAAGRLDLAGQVSPEDFRAVLAGRDPRDGTGLVPGAGRPGRVLGFDLTFSPPKSVSVAWALADQQSSERIAAAHDRAVADAMTAIEQEVIRARRGHGGLRQVETDGVAAAAFAHRTSRAGDPQLHTHVVVANLTVDHNGRWSAPDGRRVYGWKKTVGYLYQAALRQNLTEDLGMQWAPVAKGAAEGAGFTPAQLAGFSQRRAQITAALDQFGYSSAKAAEAATLATRPAKDPAATLADLRAGWAQRAQAMGIGDVTHLFGRAAPGQPPIEPLVEQLVAPDGLTRAASSFDRRDVLCALAEQHRSGASIDQLRAGADRVVVELAVVELAVATPAGGTRYSTAELLALETRLLDSAKGRSRASVAVVPVAALEQVLAARPSLSGEQRTMVARLARSGAGVEVVVGRAGAGKTFALDAGRAAWEAAGHPVIGAALAARAAAELQAGAGIASTTIDRLLIDAERPGPHGGLRAGSVLVVDEAGMVGTRKLGRILDAAERSAAKVVLVGDPRQLPEIDAGGLFANLARDLPAVELVDNRRQQQQWERATLAELRSGSVPAAVVSYHQAGRITTAPTADAVREALVGDWWAARQAGAQTAMYALRRSDVNDLNDRARRHLRAAGLLGDDALTVAGRDLAAGDEIMFLRNDRRLGIRNGGTATIDTINQPGVTITVTTSDAQPLTIPAEYLTAGQVTHAYATTIHKAQGATVDRAFLLGSDEMYREAGYVGLSRARQRSDLYIVTPPPTRQRGRDDLAANPVTDLAARLGVSRAQQTASDQVHPSDPTSIDGHDWRQQRQRIVERRQALGAAAADHPPPHLIDLLGPPPAAGADRDRWVTVAGHIEAYREEHHVADERQPLGPKPESPAERIDWHHTRQAIDHYHHRHLDQGLAL